MNVNSEGHRGAETVDFSAMDASRWKRGFKIYSQTKLANLLFTYELARRLEEHRISVNAVHPGIVDTQLFRTFLAERVFRPGSYLSKVAAYLIGKVAFSRYKFDTAEKAAECPAYLASSPEVAAVTGKYFNCDRKIIDTSPASYDLALSQRIWTQSEQLVHLTGPYTKF